MQAKGSFDVTLTRHPEVDAADGVQIGQAGIQKQFHGDLEATSQGRMLSVISPQPGSAGYVAIERVTGSLAGKRGSFVLQHDGLMNRGAQSLTVHVVPDTATGELSGRRGSMRIDIVEGKLLDETEFQL